MLVLQRKRNQIICVGQDLEIEVLRFTPSSVILGITAPEDVQILRKELVHAPVSSTHTLSTD
ncbi:MAG: carbon storage regulator [Candidatus Thorarchaeota archaeon]